ncbi:hypothetical protein NDU88_002149 [Pleurodeles waltl]|uniref:Uncharacterized protein n=1 Tax=Pleurodeles waltl TaxID=8319 RepID=A0AAV7LZP7_PLEWA|nr:hypothetical protein NDU88_002149 [Pleurodeles waltl]
MNVRQSENQDGGSARGALPGPRLGTGLPARAPRAEPQRVARRALGPGLSPHAEERCGRGQHRESGSYKCREDCLGQALTSEPPRLENNTSGEREPPGAPRPVS